MSKIINVKQEKGLEIKCQNCAWMTFESAFYNNWFEYDIIARRGKSLIKKCIGPSKYYGKSLVGSEARECDSFRFK